MFDRQKFSDQLFERTKRRTTFREIGNAVARMGYDSKIVGVKTPADKISKIWKYYCRPTMGNDDDFIILPELPKLTFTAPSTSLQAPQQMSTIEDKALAIDEFDTFFD